MKTGRAARAGGFTVGIVLLAWLAPSTPARTSDAAQPAPEVVTNSIGMKLVRIPAGQFEMGSDETARHLADIELAAGGDDERDGPDDGGSTDDERPVHRVRITKPFLMGQTEVTLGQFLAFYHDGYAGKLDCETGEREGSGWGTGSPPYSVRPDYRPWHWGHPGMDLATEAGKRRASRFPVVNVSWTDADAFCKWLSRQEHRTYRLPTEAEWEYACRAGTTTRFWTGNDPETLAGVENVPDATRREQYACAAIRGRDGHVFTSPVASFRPNPFGLYDMHGNVSEWCLDDWDPDFYARSPVDDPRRGMTFIDGVEFFSPVIRGGNYALHPVNGRSADRMQIGLRGTLTCWVGFRVVCEEVAEPDAGPKAEQPVAAREERSLLEQAEQLCQEGRHVEAEPLAKRALDETIRSKGEDHPDTARSLHVLGSLFAELKRDDEAEPLLKRAIAIRETTLGPEHLETADSVESLGYLYLLQEKPAEGEPLLKRAIAIREKQLGPEHADTAETLIFLAAWYARQNRLDEAEPLQKRALAIMQKVKGLDDPWYAITLRGLAKTYDKQGKHAQAEPLYASALEIFEASLGPDHEFTTGTRKDLSALRAKQAQRSTE